MTREEEIFKQLKSGDCNAAEELVRLYYKEIFNYCRYHVPDIHLAEDAVQETFLKVCRYMDRYRHRGKFKAFLYQVAANTCIDICRKRRDGAPLEEIAFWERGLAEGEDRQDFGLLIGGLPKELQEIVFLRFSQELKLREIAAVLDLPLRTVQTRLRKALKLLKEKIEESGWETDE